MTTYVCMYVYIYIYIYVHTYMYNMLEAHSVLGPPAGGPKRPFVARGRRSAVNPRGRALHSSSC